MLTSESHRASNSFDSSIHYQRPIFSAYKPSSPIKPVNTPSLVSHKRAKSEAAAYNRQENKISYPHPQAKLNYLNNTLWCKEIYIIKDGISSKEEVLSGFTYKFFNFGSIKRQQQKQELEVLLETCGKRWGGKRKFISLFNVEGKLLKSLAEVEPSCKVAVVGQSFNFSGFKDPIGEKEILEIVEEHFASKDKDKLTVSPRKKGILYPDDADKKAKSFLLKFRNKSTSIPVNKTIPRKLLFRPNKFKYISQIKEKLGETSAKLDRSIPKMEHKTLKKLMEKYELSESNIHKIYAQYKTLLIMSVAQNPNHNFKSGINNNTLIQCLRKGEIKEDGLIEKLIKTIDVDQKGYLTWEEFLKAMSVIHFGSLSHQIDMLFKMYDSDFSGSLSYTEIQELCKRQLKTKNDDKIAAYLSESFAKIIFALACVPVTDSLSPGEIKRVLSNKDDQSIIRMFCNFEN